MTLSCSPRLSRQEAGEGQPSPHLPRSRDCRFSRSAALPVCHPERSSHFFASGVEGSTRSDFFFPARFQANRFAAIPPRVRFGLRLAHLVGMTNEGHARKSTARKRERTDGRKLTFPQGVSTLSLVPSAFEYHDAQLRGGG